MITLAIDTSTALGSIAVLQDDRPLAERTFGRDGLFPALRELNPPALDAFAVGLGPGSFTGIRAGIAAVKGLALPGGKPIKGVTSFDALAIAAARFIPRDCPQMCVLCDARRDEVYYAIYNSTGQRQTAIRIAALQSIADEIHNPIWFVSPEIEKFAADIRLNFGGFATVCEKPITPSAAALGWLAHRGEGADKLEPVYLRETSYRKA